MLPLDEFAEHVFEASTTGAMLGALDADHEMRTEEPVAPATFERLELRGAGVKDFATKPFQAAIDAFHAKKVVTRSAFDRMSSEERSRAFTVAGLATRDLVALAKDELGKALERGDDLRKFRGALADRLEDAGWTALNPSHVETIFRNGVMGAYSRGRRVQMTQPEVLAARPYWQITGANDSRTRKTHRAAHGKVLEASDSFWQKASPPFGHNCRCRLVSRSAADVKRLGLSVTSGDSIQGLPDPDWDNINPPVVPPGIAPPGPAKETEAKPEEQTPIERIRAKVKRQARSTTLLEPDDSTLWKPQRDALRKLEVAPRNTRGHVTPEAIGLKRATPIQSKEIKRIAEDLDLEVLARQAALDWKSEEIDVAKVVIDSDRLNAKNIAKRIRAESNKTGFKPANFEQLNRAVVAKVGDTYHVIHLGEQFAADALMSGEGISSAKPGHAWAVVVDVDPTLAQAAPIRSSRDAGKALRKAFRTPDGLEDLEQIRHFGRGVLANEGLLSRDIALAKKGASRFTRFPYSRADAAALHTWDGAVEMDPHMVAKLERVASKLEMYPKGRPLLDNLYSSEAEAMNIAIHEEIHGTIPILSSAYREAGMGLEEASTELLARATSRRLIGVTDAELPDTHPIKNPKIGSTSKRRAYDHYIGALYQHLEEAGVPAANVAAEAERVAKVLRSKVTKGQIYATPEEHIRAFASHVQIPGPAQETLAKKLASASNMKP